MAPLRTAALLGCILLPSACSDGRDARPNVLLVTVDTLRADRLGCYGAAAGTPHVDGLARRGVRFETARVPIPRTTQSLASLLTGVYPSTHRVRALLDRLPKERETLPELLQTAGYRTGAAVAVPFFRQGQGLAQGIDEYREFGEDVDAEAVSDAAIAFFEARDGDDRPFFHWLHYRDPHIPYGPPAEYRPTADFDTRSEEAFFFYPIAGRKVGPADRPPDAKARKAAMVYGTGLPDAAELDRAVALYDAEVRYTDAQIGRVLDHLRAEGLLDDTIVVFTSDHGESLGEHDYHFDHGEFLYETCLRVPLLIVGPGLPSRVVETPVRTIDVVPTLLDLLDLAAPDVQGESLRGLVEGRTDRAPGPLLAEGGASLVYDTHPRRPVAGVPGRPTAIVAGPWKLIHTPGVAAHGGYELYDLASDPEERSNLAARPPPELRLDALKKSLSAFAEIVHRPVGRETAADPEQLRKLESVGYLR